MYQDPNKDNNISFIDFKQSRYFSVFIQEVKPNAICLVDQSIKLDLIELLPLDFTITTNNGSYHFNTDLLCNTSSTIQQLFADDYDISIPYHLDIDDDQKVLMKFEQLYQGKLVFFTEEELPIAQQITKLLHIIRCPNYLKPTELRQKSDQYYGFKNDNDDENDLESGVIINKKTFFNFLNDDLVVYFLIKTKKNQYECNCYGVRFSKVIREFLLKNPYLENFDFDYDDEFGEFQSICDFFNFKKVTITTNNINALKQIAEELQIDAIIEKINNYINSYEKIAKKFDGQQELIDSIENLFDLLYNIKSHSVDFVYDSIIDSFWVTTKENIQELVAFILQVIENDLHIHSYLANLIEKLNENANEENQLNILLPFLVSKLIKTLGKNRHYCSFVYKLYKKGLISKEELIKKIPESIQYANRSHLDLLFENYMFFGYYDEENFISNIVYWFLPELIESDFFDYFKSKITNDCQKFVKNFLPDKIDLYIKMRDKDEPDNELAIALRNDDIDSLQLIVSKNQIDILKGIVPFNIFDQYSKLNFLDYSALHGSIKCFKYLLLNHAVITDATFEYSIFGGNTEMIRIIDNELKKEKDNKDKKENKDSGYFNRRLFGEKKDINHKILCCTIEKHQNDLFDWIFEYKMMSKEISDYSLFEIVECCVKNGNAHALIEIIAKGYDAHDIKFLTTSLKNGFYRLSVLMLNILNFKKDELNNVGVCPCVFFGNLSIFNLHQEISSNTNDINKALKLVIFEDMIEIVKYFFEVLANDCFKVKDTILLQAYQIAIASCSDDIINYLFDKFPAIKWSKMLHMKEVFIFGKKKIVKKIIDLILDEKDKNNDTSNSLEENQYNFTNPFILLAQNNEINLCKYLIDKKVDINYELLCKSANDFISHKDIFILIYNNSPSDIKDIYLNISLHHAIMKENIGLIKFLLDRNAVHEKALFEAVKTRKLEIVETILNYDQSPSFVNKKLCGASALSISIKYGDINIVKRLLSIPGIDLNMFDSNKDTPLMIATKNLNQEIILEILKLFEKNYTNSARIQIDELMNKICGSLFSSKKNNKVLEIFKQISQFTIIDINYYCEKFALFSNACECQQISLIDFLLTIDKIDVNFCNPINDRTPLMNSIGSRKKQVFDLLIKHPRVNINFKNNKDETPLTLSCDLKNIQAIDILIKDERFDPEENKLNLCFFKSTGEVSKLLYSCKSLDVNYKVFNESYCSYETALNNAVRFKDIEKINLIIQHPSFDKNKSCLQKALFKAIEINHFEIFKALFQLSDNERENFLYNGRSIFSVALDSYNSEVINEILNRFCLDSKKDNILVAFSKISVLKEKSFDIMELLYEYDQKHDHLINFSQLLPNGKSFFTSLCPFYKQDHFNQTPNQMYNIRKIVDFLLNNGADPNMIDKFDFYPLEHAIYKNSDEFVTALLNSNKIDFSVKIENKFNSKETPLFESYLHLAAEASFPIFKQILEKSEIDINVEDSDGNTPLIIAVKNHKIQNVQLLFERDDLDYLHRNNNNKNALEIILHHGSNNTVDRKEFLMQIIALIKRE